MSIVRLDDWRQALDSLASSSALSLPSIFTWSDIYCSVQVLFFCDDFVDGLDDSVADSALALLDGLQHGF
ncbi:hypothetical protein TNCV_1860151 [Trichonephila clavipes]|nr:hypothetical protein TNCV_1860151 [Trichonephila clavipes]